MPIPQIISQALWDRARDRRAQNKREATRNRQYPYLLAGGRLRCGICGGAMTGELNHGRQVRYRCTNSKRHHSVPHPRQSVMGAEVEPDVWAQVERILGNPALVLQELGRRQEQAAHAQADRDRERASYQRQLTTITGEQERLLDIYLDGTIPGETFKARNADLDMRKQKIERELAALDATVQAIETGALTLEMVYAYFRQVDADLQELSPEKQAQAVRTLGIVATWTPGEPLAITGEVELGIVLSSLD